MTCTTASGHVVTLAEADAGKVVNTVNVSGKPPVGADVTGTDTLTTTITRNPHLTYELKVTSDGNVTVQKIGRASCREREKFEVINDATVTLNPVGVTDD